MYEQKPSNLPFIQSTWRARVVQEDEYDDPAKDTWGLAFTKHSDGSLAAELLGQSFGYKVLGSTVGDEYWGVEFYSYVTMRGVDKPKMVGKLVPLEVAEGHFSIGSDTYKIPTFENLEVFCQDLAEQGIISHTARLLSYQKLSLRSAQRRHRQAVGLTHKQVEQIKRAEHAASLLRSGMTLTEVVAETGYADQAHMTRSLKSLLGKTPTKIRQTK